MPLRRDRWPRAKLPDVGPEGMAGVAAIAYDPSALGRSILAEAAASGSRGVARPADGPAAPSSAAARGPDPAPAGRRSPDRYRPRSRKPCSHSHHESGHRTSPDPPAGCRHSRQVLHDGLAPLQLPLSRRTRRLLVGADARAIDERHPELHAALLDETEQTLPDPEPGPAVERLWRHPP